jgi:hypothetical protein
LLIKVINDENLTENNKKITCGNLKKITQNKPFYILIPFLEMSEPGWLNELGSWIT